MRSQTLQPLQAAETIAVNALTYIASDSERLGRFLAETGLGPQTLHSAAADRGFLAGILEYLSRDESLILAFAAEAGLDPAHITVARQILSDHAGKP